MSAHPFMITALWAVCAGFLAFMRPHPELSGIAQVGRIAGDPKVISAVQAQNRLPISDIPERDSAWRAQAARGDRSGRISEILETPLSRSLAIQRNESHNQIEQIMVMDARGILVAADHMTHDYDQSDEPKWTLTVGQKNPKPVLESSRLAPRGVSDQVSQAIVDKDGTIIGAVTLVWCRRSGGCDTVKP